MTHPGFVTREEHDAKVPVFCCTGCDWERQMLTYEQYERLRTLVTPEEVESGRFSHTADEYMSSIQAANDKLISEHRDTCEGLKRMERELEAVKAKAREFADSARPGSVTVILMRPDGQGGISEIGRETIKEGRLDS